MSFDIVAFDPSAISNAKFGKWYERQVDWAEGVAHDDPSVARPALRAFYDALAAIYPPLNGPGAPTQAEIDADPDLESRLTDYSIAPQLIYAAFPWSRQQQATKTFEGLAARHRVAVARVSRDPLTISRPRLVRGRWPFRRR